MRIAVLDDWQGVARGLADWSVLEGLAEPVFFADPIPPDRAVDMLADAMLDNAALKDLLGKMYGPPRYCKVFVRDGVVAQH